MTRTDNIKFDNIKTDISFDWLLREIEGRLKTRMLVVVVISYFYRITI